MTGSDFDIVTVYHCDRNKAEAEDLAAALEKYESDVNLIMVDNTKINRGFAKGCNYGADQGEAPYIGFLNPDVTVNGPFTPIVRKRFQTDDVVITGERFGKPPQEVRMWGLSEWVCGAVFFVKRSWFDMVGGFDERFVLYFEETDLCRQAEAHGLKVRAISLPIEHSSPTQERPQDIEFKRKHMARSGKLFFQKWGR